MGMSRLLPYLFFFLSPFQKSPSFAPIALLPTSLPLFLSFFTTCVDRSFLFFPMFFFSLMSCHYIFIISHGGLLVLYFFPLLPFLSFYLFLGASEVAGMRFFLYIIGISIFPTLLPLLLSAAAAAEARDPASQLDGSEKEGKKASHDRQAEEMRFFFIFMI